VGPAQVKWLCFKDFRYILFEILASRTWKGRSKMYLYQIILFKILKMCYQNLLRNFWSNFALGQSKECNSVWLRKWTIGHREFNYCWVFSQLLAENLKNFGGDFGNTFSKFCKFNLIYILAPAGWASPIWHPCPIC